MSDTTCGYPGCVNGYVRAVFGPVPCFACGGRPERPAVALDPVSEANGVLVHPPAVSSCNATASTPRVAPGGEPETASVVGMRELLAWRETAALGIARYIGPPIRDEMLNAVEQLFNLARRVATAPHAADFRWLVRHDPYTAAVYAHGRAESSATVTALDSRLATAERERDEAQREVATQRNHVIGYRGVIEILGAGLSDAEASRARAEQEAATLREEWWLAHGFAWHGSTAALYGDDGEMSCNACGIDFKREPVEQIKARLMVKSLAGATVEPPERPDATATEGAPESVDLAVDKGARTAQRLPSRSSPDAVSTSALRPDETPPPASTADLDQRDRALER